MASRKAIRPDQRCRVPIHAGAARSPGSLPYMARAEASWTSANTKARLAIQVFAASAPENPAKFTAIAVGSCSRPYTPRATEMAPPTRNGTISVAAPLDRTGVVVVSKVMGSSQSGAVKRDGGHGGAADGRGRAGQGGRRFFVVAVVHHADLLAVRQDDPAAHHLGAANVGRRPVQP